MGKSTAKTKKLKKAPSASIKQFAKSAPGVLALAIIVFAVGFGVGYAVNQSRQQVPPVLATQAEKDVARREIVATYMKDGTTCKNDSMTQPERVETFDAYLKVNAYANRALMRLCGDSDVLLAKINGRWLPTDINIRLDSRQNPTWQQACEIQDITMPDTIVRSENASIDASNLKTCTYIADHNALPKSSTD